MNLWGKGSKGVRVGEWGRKCGLARPCEVDRERIVPEAGELRGMNVDRRVRLIHRHEEMATESGTHMDGHIERRGREGGELSAQHARAVAVSKGVKRKLGSGKVTMLLVTLAITHV